MADIFLSYASTDRAKAGTLAALLQSAGWSVWWDRDLVGGDEWEPAIESELRASRCVVVLWTRRSISSRWVIREARAARDRKVMLPVLLEPVSPPDELAEVHATALTAWVGEERSFELRPFLDRLAELLGSAPPSVEEGPMTQTVVKLSRIEVAEAVFDFCAARLEFYRLNNSTGVPERTLERMRHTYGALCEILSPISSNDIHRLLVDNESAYNPDAV